MNPGLLCAIKQKYGPFEVTIEEEPKNETRTKTAKMFLALQNLV